MQPRKKIFDYLPFAVLLIEAGFMLYSILFDNTVFKINHLIALSLLPLICIGFKKNHQLGVLLLGLSIFLGILTLAAFDAAIITSSFYWKPFGLNIPLFWGNPFLLVLFIIHFVISRRYYFGILTKKYWSDFGQHINKSINQPTTN